jgi:5-methylcytosine-specific restriction protein A
MVYIRPSELYPSNWNKLRFAIFKKHSYICERCNRYSKGNLQLHHKIPVKLGGNHDESNLEVLCSDCHYEVHLKRKYK